jgi:hypothetical protein
MVPLPHFIIISGSGKKVGKTFLATGLIRHFSASFPVVGLKISPHRHDSLGDAELIHDSEGIRIFRETGPHRKNTGQFLEAGASAAYFMETDDSHLMEGLKRLEGLEGLKIFSPNGNAANLPVICESGALGSFVRPGILICIVNPADSPADHKLAAMKKADLVLPARVFIPEEVAGGILFREDGWRLRKK